MMGGMVPKEEMIPKIELRPSPPDYRAQRKFHKEGSPQ